MSPPFLAKNCRMICIVAMKRAPDCCDDDSIFKSATRPHRTLTISISAKREKNRGGQTHQRSLSLKSGNRTPRQNDPQPAIRCEVHKVGETASKQQRYFAHV